MSRPLPALALTRAAAVDLYRDRAAAGQPLFVDGDYIISPDQLPYEKTSRPAYYRVHIAKRSRQPGTGEGRDYFGNHT